ncbi:MAG: hypothetical protein A2804_01405 [Candidatus Pacebacteria bacterium RIFCSPHIGHO2_01_FULL_46_10]|nr:MAG: hypothetical protein A2804_01405 [Candidatus Pacebacteria bacterium RIFCSPHIGHO2_01_FULL_46_10]
MGPIDGDDSLMKRRAEMEARLAELNARHNTSTFTMAESRERNELAKQLDVQLPENEAYWEWRAENSKSGVRIS